MNMDNESLTIDELRKLLKAQIELLTDEDCALLLEKNVAESRAS
jgi:hypothetical protein